jgi:glutaryl-CoA dehydrogenase
MTTQQKGYPGEGPFAPAVAPAVGLAAEEQLIAQTVGDWVRRRFLPILGDAWRAGALPPELTRELGELGPLGMNLEGYGCAGATATAYGLACLEPEAGEAGFAVSSRSRARSRRSRSTASAGRSSDCTGWGRWRPAT